MTAMRSARKGGLHWFLICVRVLWGFTVATNLAPVAATIETAPPVSTRDNSDWWSLTRTDDELVPQEGDLQDSNFQILGFKLNDETFGKAKARLGKATVRQARRCISGAFPNLLLITGREIKDLSHIRKRRGQRRILLVQCRSRLEG
jgi:hypothetical protein